MNLTLKAPLVHRLYFYIVPFCDLLFLIRDFQIHNIRIRNFFLYGHLKVMANKATQKV